MTAEGWIRGHVMDPPTEGRGIVTGKELERSSQRLVGFVDGVVSSDGHSKAQSMTHRSKN